jgi:glucose-1-phosphate thymidylyltransferase
VIIKAIVLAGGYARRLWPLTKELAKPLVDVGGRPVISYILAELDKSSHISEILISTNAKFEEAFNKWLATQRFSKPVKVVAEPTLAEGEKLGAIGGINFVFEKENISDEVLIMGGDNLIGIDINNMIEDFKSTGAPHVGVYDIKDRERVKQLGEVTINADKKIIRFREKPEQPETTLISTACYLFPAGVRAKLKEYISSGGNKDAPGYFIKWLSEKTDVYAHVFDSYWFDIGDHKTLEQAREFTKKYMIK